MYFKKESQKSIISVTEDFATLVSMTNDGKLEFEFSLDVSQVTAIKEKSVSVDVTVYSNKIKKDNIASIHAGNIDTKTIISNIQKDVQNAKSIAKNQQDYVIAKTTSDLSAKIDNSIIKKVTLGVNPKEIESLYKTKLKLANVSDLKMSNDVKPSLDIQKMPDNVNVYTAVSSSLSVYSQETILKGILQYGIDPSDVTSYSNYAITANDSQQGFSSIRNNRLNVTQQKLQNSIVVNNQTLQQKSNSNEGTSVSKVPVSVSEFDDRINVKSYVTFKKPKTSNSVLQASTNNDEVVVKFELKNSYGEIVQTIEKSLNISKHVNAFSVPTKPPVVKLVKSDIGKKVNIEIKQVDEKADSVKLYRKNVYASVNDVDSYTYVTTYSLSSKQKSLIVPVEVPMNSCYIYRVIACNSSYTSGEFTNVIVRPSKYTPKKATSITAKNESNGIKIEITKFPANVVSIQLYKRNLSIKESAWSVVGTPLTTQRRDDNNHYSIRIPYVSYVDIDVIDNDVYEYTAKLYVPEGTIDSDCSEVIEKLPIATNKAEIKVANLLVDDSSTLDVTFDVDVSILATNTDIVKQLLEQSGNKQYYDDDIKVQRERLTKPLAYSIERVDMLTGDREDFGIINDKKFSDASNRKLNAVSPLKRGRTYRYVINAHVRSAETMFDDLTVKKVDFVTKKNYNVLPSKSLNPITMKTGTVTTVAGLKTLHAKNVFKHGFLGVENYIEATISDEFPSIASVTVKKFDSNNVVVEWQVKGNTKLIDHFIITSVTNSVTKIIGKSHSESSDGNFRYIASTKGMFGQYTFGVRMILNDYTVVDTAISNLITI